MSKSFIIPDVHGHYDRLKTLLVQEGIVDPVTEQRINFDVEVVQLGDLGHFGRGGSPTGDLLCYEKADEWFDQLLFGNHDYGVVSRLKFNGYVAPNAYVTQLIEDLRTSGKLKFAHAAHGHLLTHAGLHPVFGSVSLPIEQRIPRSISDDVEAIADFINKNPHIAEPIGPRRGGRSPYGGILWRDASESLHPRVRQIFGHTRGDRVRRYYTKAGSNFCLDVGTHSNGRLTGMWLPERREVGVQVPAAQSVQPVRLPYSAG